MSTEKTPSETPPKIPSETKKASDSAADDGKKPKKCCCSIKECVVGFFKKSCDFTKYYYESALAKISEHPLCSYNALYVTACAALSGGAYYFHKHFLAVKACDNCHHANKPLHMALSLGVCLTAMGVGNYLYLKKSPKKD